MTFLFMVIYLDNALRVIKFVQYDVRVHMLYDWQNVEGSLNRSRRFLEPIHPYLKYRKSFNDKQE